MSMTSSDGNGETSGSVDLSSRRTFLRGTGAVVAAGAVTAATRGWLAPFADAATAGGASTASPIEITADSEQIAQGVVTFGIPAVLQKRYLKISKKAGIAINQFSVNTKLSTPATTALGPNDDTLYGLAWLNLSDEPQVIEVPATPDRYFSIQLIDMWSNPFAYIGTRATGDKAGAFAIVGPGFVGHVPTGVTRINAPTKRILALVRTFVKDPADLKAAVAIHTSYTTGSLSDYPETRTKAQVDGKALNVFTPIDLTEAGLPLFEEINNLLLEYPPLPADAKHTKNFPQVGVGVAEYAKPSFGLASILAGAVDPSIEAIQAEQAALPTQVNGWSVDYHVDNITHNPLKRAALCLDGPGTHINKEALYFGISELDGAPLTGAGQYLLSFPAGQLPPVDAFWSLILYNAETFLLVANSINRYEVASHTDGLVYDAGGALAIQVQNTQPTTPGGNWLPAPKGAFRLVLRTYLPKPSVLDGSWKPPVLVKTA
jgi:hypothetical protein